jgi:hypothetical protein
MKQIEVSSGKHRFHIVAKLLFVGEDLVVSIWGGNKPHVGAVAMAVPRPSLRNPDITSSTSSVLTRVGHKEDDIVKRVSERLSAELGRHVVVTAGIHWDAILDDEIDIIRSACDELTDKLIDKVRERGQ